MTISILLVVELTHLSSNTIFRPLFRYRRGSNASLTLDLNPSQESIALRTPPHEWFVLLVQSLACLKCVLRNYDHYVLHAVMQKSIYSLLEIEWPWSNYEHVWKIPKLFILNFGYVYSCSTITYQVLPNYLLVSEIMLVLISRNKFFWYEAFTAQWFLYFSSLRLRTFHFCHKVALLQAIWRRTPVLFRQPIWPYVFTYRWTVEFSNG